MNPKGVAFFLLVEVSLTNCAAGYGFPKGRNLRGRVTMSGENSPGIKHWRPDLDHADSTLFLGRIAHLRDNPFEVDHALEIIEKGGLVVDGKGKVLECGDGQALRAKHPDASVRDFGLAWLLPGFVDGHIHFPQMNAVASEAGTLMHWLTEKIYPAEMALADPEVARDLAARFVRRLLSCGTTTAMVFGSQFLEANRCLFRAASTAGLNLIAGMTMMDCRAPASLCTSPEETYRQVTALLSEVSGHPGTTYAITPRFALACSEAMLEVCRTLAREFPECPIQTHINESPEEIRATAEAFAWAGDYLAVYERAELLRPGTVLAHNIHACDAELARLAASGAAVCHCPNSNLFLGSGLFPLRKHLQARIPVLLGTDIGAGLRFCLLDEMSEAYKVQKLQGERLDAAQLLYLATLGGQIALGRGDRVGNFEKGKAADIVVVQPARDADIALRLYHADSPQAALFALIMTGGAQLVEETIIGGKVCYRNGAIAN